MKKLRLLRERAGLRQTELSAITAVPSARISAIETGYLMPRPTALVLKRLAIGLGIPASEASTLLDEVDF